MYGRAMAVKLIMNKLFIRNIRLKDGGSRVTEVRNLFMVVGAILAWSVLSGWSVVAKAEHYKTMPDSLDGSMMVYDFGNIRSGGEGTGSGGNVARATVDARDTEVEVPDSLEVVHVAYVARHGARYLSSAKKVTKLSEMLRKQMLDGTISGKGAEFLCLLDSIALISKDKWGALSEVGIQEEERLGQEMARLCPSLMEKGSVYAKSSYVSRVVMTMYQFVHSLAKAKTRLNVRTLEGPVNDSLLRCFDTFRTYREYRDSGMWISVTEEFMRNHVSPRPAMSVFGLSDKDIDKARELTMDMYSVLQGLRAMGLAEPTDRFMTESEYRACWEAANLERYLRNTLNPLSTGCAGATAMLIEDIISDCDTFANADSPDVPLSAWFGHAETLMPMLSVMDITGCAYFTDDWDSVASHWRSQDIVPLGANFMLILMRSKSVPNNAHEANNKGSSGTNLYAAIRLNGRNLAPYPGAPRIIAWPELKSHWLDRIALYSFLDVTP